VKNPTRVAKLVMETTDHVLLVGPGARHFATLHGFADENLLTEKARKVWLFWKQNLSDKDKWLEPDPDHYPPEVKEFIQEFGWDEFRKAAAGRHHPSLQRHQHARAGASPAAELDREMPPPTRMFASPVRCCRRPHLVSVKHPAPRMGESPTRPGILKNSPLVDVHPPRSPRPVEPRRDGWCRPAAASGTRPSRTPG